jgi:uncharacterized protein with HEPN domain
MDEGVAARLHDMAEAIAGTRRAMAGKTFEDYKSDWLLRLASQRALEIVSEASRHLPADLKAAYPYPHWQQVAGIGNVLRHEYHSVSDAIVWNVLVEHLPELEAVARRMLAEVATR